MEKAAAEGWPALTNDTRAATEHADFLITSGIRLFVIRFKYKNGKDLRDKILERLEEIDRLCGGRPPFVYDMLTSPDKFRRRKLRTG